MYLCWVEGREIEKEEDLGFALADVTDAMQQRGYV